MVFVCDDNNDVSCKDITKISFWKPNHVSLKRYLNDVMVADLPTQTQQQTSNI